MKIGQHRIEEACSKETTQYALTFVNFNREKSRLEASNGKILAVVPVSEVEENEVSGAVPTDALKLARKPKQGRGQILLNGKAEVPFAGQTFGRPQDAGKFPDVDACVPKKPKGNPDVILDAELLHRLAKAINADGKAGTQSGKNGIQLWFKRDKAGKVDRKGAIFAESVHNSEGAFGVIMPIVPLNR